MKSDVKDNEVFGFIRPYNDVHSLGIASVGKLLENCGYKVFYGDLSISEALTKISKIDNISLLIKWINANSITRIGFSYRLDPMDAQTSFGKTYYQLKDNNMFSYQGGSIEQIYFAGLPDSCHIIEKEYDNTITTFIGDETQIETLLKLGVPEKKIPAIIYQGSKYDDELFSFAKQLINKGDFEYQLPIKRRTYPNFGSKNDTINERIINNRKASKVPLFRVHVGPYDKDYKEAKKEFNSWLKILSETKYLDIVSIGSSQLTQSSFGENWEDKPNGGGVPINSEQDLRDIWNASRPMLLRTYSGTKDTAKMAKIYEENLNMAWHALSLWWFNQIDGRGPNDVRTSLERHFEAIRYIAKVNKPFEPNIPHHFSFRGGDDYTYVLSAYLAALLAKKMGIKTMVIQTMLNTPKYTWGVQDLAKARAVLQLVRELEDANFTIFHQPRAGLDYFSPNLNKAKVQLAAVSAMMDDIEPNNDNSPDIIHVVSYCEAVRLATPDVINESIQITINSLEEYRKQKAQGKLDDMKNNKDVISRTKDLYTKVKEIVKILETRIDNLYSPEGFYQVFKIGAMPVPYLWEGREEFANAVKWNTGLINGAVKVIDENGKEIDPVYRVMGLE